MFFCLVCFSSLERDDASVLLLQHVHIYYDLFLFGLKTVKQKNEAETMVQVNVVFTICVR